MVVRRLLVMFLLVVCCWLGASADAVTNARVQSQQSATEELEQLMDFLGSPGSSLAATDEANKELRSKLTKVVARLRGDPGGQAKGALAELHLLGLADERTQELKPPDGFPRSMSQAVIVAAAGAASGGCGRCFFLLGALIEQGEPESSKSAIFNVREGGRVEFRWSPSGSRPQSLGMDRPALAYYVGAELGDPLARLAFSRYVSEGLTLGPTDGEWWQGALHAEEDSALLSHGARREPKAAAGTDAELNRCQRALKMLSPVAEDAAYNEDHSMDSSSDLNFEVEKAWEVAQAKKEHADWVAAHARENHNQADEIAHAAYHLHGDADIGIQRNEPKARVLFEKVAAKGNLEAVWSALLLHARIGDVARLEQNVKRLIEDPDASQVRKVVAQHYAHRHGFGVERNATRAGAYLIMAADLGDANAQQTLAHGYAGVSVSELDGVRVPGSPNQRRAIQYYTLAARQGRPVSAVNAAALLMQASTDKDHLHTCRAALHTYRDVSLAYHPAILRMHAHARRAFQLGDLNGALLRFQLLSELGAKNAHQNAAALWSQPEESMTHQYCWRQPSLQAAQNCRMEYLYRAAVFSGSIDAMLKLSSVHASIEDESAAFYWSSRAASAGDSHALYTVAYHKHHGLGTPKDLLGACADYCQLWQRSNDSFLQRTLAFAQATRVQRSLGEDCCDLPDVRPYLLAAGGVGTIVLLLVGASLAQR